jgi:hypothetical protein
MRRMYAMRDGKLVEVFPAPARPRVHIRSSEIPPTYHPAIGVGKGAPVFTCVSKLRAETKRLGHIEYGDQQIEPMQHFPKPIDWDGFIEKTEQALTWKNDEVVPGVNPLEPVTQVEE